jgi:hypothetical protein
MKTFIGFLIAVCVTTASAQGECDRCVGATQHSYPLDNQGDTRRVCLCHGQGQGGIEGYSLLTYNCDWQNYQFGLAVKPLDEADVDVILEQEPISVGRSEEPESRMQVLDRSDYDFPHSASIFQKSFPYFRPTLRECNSTVAVRDNNLCHESKVKVTVHLSPRQAPWNQYLYVLHYNVFLSCCACPQPACALIVPPLHRYCNITECANPSVFNCVCRLDNNGRYEFSVNSLLPLPSGLDLQLSSVVAYPDVPSPRPSLTLIPSLGVPAELQLQTSPALSVNHFVFTSHREEEVKVQCSAQLCVKNAALANSNQYPACNRRRQGAEIE